MVHFEKEGTHFGQPRVEIHDFLILLKLSDALLQLWCVDQDFFNLFWL